MGFFATVGLWIKRLLFIVLMAMCALFIIAFLAGDNSQITVLSVILGILALILSVGNCVLYFMFAENARVISALGLIVHAAILVVLLQFSSDGAITISLFCALFCLLILFLDKALDWGKRKTL